MAPPKVEEYVRSLFKGSSIKLEVVSDIQQITREFPLFEAVNRAASCQERHRGRLIFLEYQPPEDAIETLFLVGKGNRKVYCLHDINYMFSTTLIP